MASGLYFGIVARGQHPGHYAIDFGHIWWKTLLSS